MKILLISTSDIGGASKACIRLHQGLLKGNIDSNLLVSYRKTPDFIEKSYIFKPFIPGSITEKIIYKIRNRFNDKKNNILKNRPDEFDIFTFPNTKYDILNHPLYKEADIINLHWTAYFLDFYSFFSKTGKKIVWTLHDMNPFTGGCHYSGDCDGFQKECKNCPQLRGTINPDYSNKILKTKLSAFQKNKNLNLTIVSPSKWLLERSKSSRLLGQFSHHLIPNSLPGNIYLPRDKNFSRKLLDLPLDEKIILFVANSINNKRKGYKYIVEAIQILQQKKNIILCTIGSSKNINKENYIYELGEIYDERLMSMAYSCADVFVIPSLEDNLPNTVLEALTCGTPVVGFPIGGIKDMIIHNENGRLCHEISEKALVEEIDYVLSNINLFNRNQISNIAAKKYALNIQAENYIALYRSLIEHG